MEKRLENDNVGATLCTIRTGYATDALSVIVLIDIQIGMLPVKF